MNENDETGDSRVAEIDDAMSMRADEGDVSTLGGAMVMALERAWARIRARHPEVPPVVVVIGAGSGQTWLKLGHFAAERWQVPDLPGDGALEDAEGETAAVERASRPLHEVFIGRRGLSRGPGGVTETLLHEAAHGLGEVGGSRTPHGRAVGTTGSSRRWPRRWA